MTPSHLRSLAERVRATGADRKLDCRISLSISGISFSEADVAELVRVRDEPTGYGRYCPADEYVPAYTASLDAAMTLYFTIPERVPSDPRQAVVEALLQRAEL